MDINNKKFLPQIELVEETWNILNSVKDILKLNGIILENYKKGSCSFRVLFDFDKINKKSIAVKNDIHYMEFSSEHDLHIPKFEFLKDTEEYILPDDVSHIKSIDIAIFPSTDFIKAICDIIKFNIYDDEREYIEDMISNLEEIDEVIEKIQECGTHDEYLEPFLILKKYENIKEMYKISKDEMELEYNKTIELFHNLFSEEDAKLTKLFYEMNKVNIEKRRKIKEEIKQFEEDEFLIKHNSGMSQYNIDTIINELNKQRNEKKKDLININNLINCSNTDKKRTLILKKTKTLLLKLRNEIVLKQLNKEFLLCTMGREKTLFPELFNFEICMQEKSRMDKLLYEHFIYYAQNIGKDILKNNSLFVLQETIENFIEKNIDCYEKI